MDGTNQTHFPFELYAAIGTAEAALAIDGRRAPALDADSRMSIGAVRCPPGCIAAWHRDRRKNSRSPGEFVLLALQPVVMRSRGSSSRQTTTP
jgi:hypothetical protein